MILFVGRRDACACVWRSCARLDGVANRRARCGGLESIGWRFFKFRSGTCCLAAHHGVNICYGSFQAPVSWYRASGSTLATVPQPLLLSLVVVVLVITGSCSGPRDVILLSLPYPSPDAMRCRSLFQDDLVVSASLDQTVRVWDTTGLRKKTVRGAPSAMVSALGWCVSRRTRVVLLFFRPD